MTEETATEPVVSEPVAEPAPVQPEPEVITPPVPEPVAEPPTAQPVEPLNPELISEPLPTPEPAQEPAVDAPPTIPNPESESQLEPTIQQVEPVSNGTRQAPENTPTPVPAPESQVVTSAFPISRARELLIKAREMIQFRKRKKLEKIRGMFLKQQTITNDDVQKLLYVSDATATRYLDQLEKEGRIKKKNAGKYLSYSRI